MNSRQRAPALEGDALHVWRVALEQEGAAFAALESTLSDDERARAARFVFARDRRRFVVARGALRQILAGYLDADAQSLRFSLGAYGKPALEGDAAGGPLSFNVAHSGELALIAVARARAVGVDLELQRPELDFRPLLDHVFTTAEQQAFVGLDDAQARALFFRGWVCKEAFIKAIGMGFSFPPTQVEVRPAADGTLTLHLAGDGAAHAAAAGDWQLRTLDAGPTHAAALVVDGPHALPQHFAFEKTIEKREARSENREDCPVTGCSLLASRFSIVFSSPFALRLHGAPLDPSRAMGTLWRIAAVIAAE